MQIADSLSEQAIIDRILKGEKVLYEIIVRRFNPFLYKIGRSYNYSHEDTEDLMQETFLDAYKSLHLFEGRSHFKTWIIRIMMNNCYRKKERLSYKNELAREINENARPMFTTTDNNTEHQIQKSELGHIIEHALAQIPFDYRMVFSLREVNGLNGSETADLLQISEANVKVRLNRAKAMLRTEMEKKYAIAELFEFNLKYCDPMVERVMKKIREL